MVVHHWISLLVENVGGTSSETILCKLSMMMVASFQWSEGRFEAKKSLVKIEISSRISPKLAYFQKIFTAIWLVMMGTRAGLYKEDIMIT